jgi:arylsulfatase A-like enzyme
MKHFISLGSIATTVLLIGGSCVSNKEEEKPTSDFGEKPNIIYILADDLGYGDLGCYGQEEIKTPHIDKMASQGMKFLNHYAGSTVCAPSRSVLMTGKHTGHTFIRGNRPHFPEGQYPLADSIQTVAEIMKEAGYTTGAYGKWGLGYPGSEGDPVNQGFDEFYGYNCQRYAHRYYPPHLWQNKEKVMLPGNEGGKKNTYAADLIQNKALEFINDHADTSFFLFLPYTIPHAELTGPKDSIYKMYQGQFPEEPYEGRSGKKPDESAAYGPDLWIPGYCPQEEPNAVFAAMVTRLDMYVGEIIQSLEKQGIANNTLVIFTSDNGPHEEGGADPTFFDSNGEFRGIKRDLYEGGIRVPMIAKWPGKIQKGSTTRHISAFYDVLPTFAQITGAQINSVDGISFLPTLLQKGNQQEHEYMYWEFPAQGSKQAVRMGKWKGVRLNVSKQPGAPVELYNLEKDPGEQNNIASEHPEEVKTIQSIMDTAHSDSDIFPLYN